MHLLFFSFCTFVEKSCHFKFLCTFFMIQSYKDSELWRGLAVGQHSLSNMAHHHSCEIKEHTEIKVPKNSTQHLILFVWQSYYFVISSDMVSIFYLNGKYQNSWKKHQKHREVCGVSIFILTLIISWSSSTLTDFVASFYLNAGTFPPLAHAHESELFQMVLSRKFTF